MATFTIAPSYEAVEASKPRVRKTALGDGYEQRIRFGLNNDPKEWRLTFSERTDSEREEILAFFEARGGYESFTWTPPRGSSGQFVCEEWDTTVRRCNRNTIAAVFRRVFEPA